MQLSPRTAFALAMVATLVVAGAAVAGDSKAQSSFGESFFSTSPPCPLKQFPTFESLIPVPQIIDPFQEDLIPMFCQVQVRRNGNDVRNARGNFETDLVVIDNNTGMAESFPVKSGKFKTNAQGRASFDFELPAELFADGFESGDVSAWSYTRTDFKRKKKADNAVVSCGASSSRSD